MKKINNKGISLIVLIITIIVVIILAAVVILTLSKNNPIESAKEATFKEDIYNFKTELEIYKAKISRNGEDVTKLYASRDTNPSIQDVITSITRKYIDRIEVREGKLIYVGNDKTEYILAKDMGLLPEDELLDDDILTELKPFITEWTVEAGDSITLPISGTCNFTVDYGDGTGEYKVTSATDEDRIHTYENAGTYTVKIEGKCELFAFSYYTISNSKLSKIIQWGNIGVKGISFLNCKNLKGPLPEPSKNSFKETTSMQRLFWQCTSLDGEIPEKFLYNCKNVTDISGAFESTKISGNISENLFKDCENVETLESFFYSCTNITGNIPEKLFSPCRKLKNVSYFFINTKVTGEIPENLFSNCPELNNVCAVFYSCRNLNGSIPKNIFKYNTKLVNCGQVFRFCSNISGEIPEELFANCPDITAVNAAFEGTKVTNIPQNLFANCNKISNFQSTFYACNKITGNAPELWNRDNVTNSRYCFTGCTNLSNYSEIPDSWK